jgi:hypothetical protein
VRPGPGPAGDIQGMLDIELTRSSSSLSTETALVQHLALTCSLYFHHRGQMAGSSGGCSVVQAPRIWEA